MKIYKCAISGDELFTDAYTVEKYHDCFYRIEGAMTSRKDTLDESKFGSNPSQEEQEEGAEDSAQSGINIVMDNRLVETGFGTKKEYTAYFKDFCKAALNAASERKPDLDKEKFRAEMTKGYKEIAEQFKDWQFFQGESMNAEGNIALMKWETPEGKTDEVPVFYFFIDGIVEEKV